MAGANLPAKKYTKSSPTITRLSFEFAGGTTQFIDIAAALSAINRRFYRQGVYYYVNSVEMYNNEDAFVDIHTLHDSYTTKNAWNRGFRTFQKMNAQVDETTSMGRPKYHDFKVYMSDRHRTTGTAKPSVYDINGAHANTVTTPSDWIYSQLVSADSDGDLNAAGTAVNQEADNFYVHMIGPHVGSSDNWTSVGLIKSYGDTRHQPQAEEPELDHADLNADPLANLFDMSSEETLNDIITRLDIDNDEPPYHLTQYVGDSTFGMCQQGRLVTTTSIGRVATIPGFCAPMGLICVDPQDTATSYRIVLNIAAGTYNGVYAERA